MVPHTTSFPKDQLEIRLLENVHPSALEVFAQAGYTRVSTLTHALDDPKALAEHMARAHVVGIRSKTQLTADVLAAGERLLAVGAFCIGTDQIDLPAAGNLGVPVFNAPFSSTRSVAELVIGALIALYRQLPALNAAAHAGKWLKQAQGAHELRGRTLGIIGYGRIGSQVSVLAEALNLRVLYYDVEPKLALGGARAVPELNQLLAQADAITLHVPDTPATRKLVDAAFLAQLKPGAILINYARGAVVDGQALADALKAGHLAGTALDVYPHEPAHKEEPLVHPLQGCSNALLTPHIGGSTEEAQEAIGRDVALKLIQFLDGGSTVGAVNVPQLTLPAQAGAHRLLHFHENRPGMLAELNRVLSELGCNIVGQYLQTMGSLGYVVLDVEQGLTEEALAAIRTLPGTLKARSLY